MGVRPSSSCTVHWPTTENPFATLPPFTKDTFFGPRPTKVPEKAWTALAMRGWELCGSPTMADFASTSPRKPDMGRKACLPDPQNRRQVETLAGYGIPEKEIAGVLEID